MDRRRESPTGTQPNDPEVVMRIGKPKRIIEVEPAEVDAPSPAAPSEPERPEVPEKDESRRKERRVPQRE